MLTEEKKKKVSVFLLNSEKATLAWSQVHLRKKMPEAGLCDETDPQEKGHGTQLGTNQCK